MQPNSKEESRRRHQTREGKIEPLWKQSHQPSGKVASKSFSSRLCSQAVVIWLDSAVRSRAWIQNRCLLMRLILYEKKPRYRDPLKLGHQQKATPPYDTPENWHGTMNFPSKLNWRVRMLKLTNLRVSTSVIWGRSGLTGDDQIGGIRWWLSQIEAHPSYGMCKFRRHRGQVALRCNLSWDCNWLPLVANGVPNPAICMPEMGRWWTYMNMMSTWWTHDSPIKFSMDEICPFFAVKRGFLKLGVPRNHPF